MKELSAVVFLDIDGTLVGPNQEIRPHVQTLCKAIVESGATVFLWSGGGLDYAERQAHHLAIEDLVETFSKDAILVTKLSSHKISCFFIDDSQQFIRVQKNLGHKGYTIPQYTGNSDDTALLSAWSWLEKELSELGEDDEAGETIRVV